MTPENYECRTCHGSMYVPDGMDPLEPDVRFCESCAIDEIERLSAGLKKANADAERFEREWYLRGDEIERLQASNEKLLRSGCGFIDTQAADEIERLQTIVDRLPKTADGVPMVPGKDHFFLPYEINGEWKLQKLDTLFRTQFMAGVRDDEISRGYSTREAAEKARQP